VIAEEIRRGAASIGLVGLLSLVLAPRASAQAFVALPYDELQPAGRPAPYEIHVPANWADTDYTLVCDQHGYNAPDPWNPLLFPPVQNDIGADETGAPCFELLLQMGYAVMGSSYRENGWAVKQGFEDTRALLAYFRERIGAPRRTIATGVSMGTAVTLKLVEECPSSVDGAVMIADFGGGASRAFDFVLAEILAWDVAFREKDGGWDRQSWGPFADPKPGLLFCSDPSGVSCLATDPASKFNAEIADPTNFGRFEFIRLVVGLENDYFSQANWTSGMFQFVPAFAATEGLADLKRRVREDTGSAVPGRVVQNLDHHYALSDEDRAYLAALPPALGPLAAAETEVLLAEMNARRYARDPAAAAYLEANFDPTGALGTPVITIKDIGDGVAPGSNDYYLHEAAAAAGDAGRLVELFRAEMNHAGFFTSQVVEALAAMRLWIETGRRPDASRFQVANPGVGDFVPFTPGPFPYLRGR
jgi:hypothetical protein